MRTSALQRPGLAGPLIVLDPGERFDPATDHVVMITQPRSEHDWGNVAVKVTALDEKSLPDLAADTLDTSSMPIDARLKALGATVGRPWRKEQKLACLSAWFAVTVQL